MPPWAARPKAIGIVQQLDWSEIPNIDKVADPFRKNFPWGIPTDQGKIGVGYRPDLVGEKITSGPTSGAWRRSSPARSCSWTSIATRWDLRSSTSGYSTNTHSDSQLNDCKNALIDIKPHLQAFLSTNVGRGLIDGSTVIAMDWDFDVALNQQKEPRIEWVLPNEGVTAYLEGWIPVAGHERPAGGRGVHELRARARPVHGLREHHRSCVGRARCHAA